MILFISHTQAMLFFSMMIAMFTMVFWTNLWTVICFSATFSAFLTWHIVTAWRIISDCNQAIKDIKRKLGERDGR